MKTLQKIGAVMNRAKWGSLVVVGSALAPLSAFAQTADFDESAITSKIGVYGGKALVVVGAFLLAVWALKALKIIK